MIETVFLAVNGTAMRGLEMNGNLLAVGASFVRDAVTVPAYRLWCIDGDYPAMVRVNKGGSAIAVEIWATPAPGLCQILLKEPPGLCLGKVRLADGEEVLGIVSEAVLCEGQREITQYGGWRTYLKSIGNR